jgi:plasmid stabilization system protein ParE
MNLIFSSVFEQDFAELVRYFAREASIEVATQFEENTYDLINRLRRNPKIGRIREDLRPVGIHSFRVSGFERYLMFYQIRGKDLILLRLRYGGMNLQALFLYLQ